MNALLVVFHKEGDDQAHQLSQSLHKRGALPNREQRICSIPCSDGLMVFCYDDKPTSQDVDQIAALVGPSTFEAKILLMHTSSRRNHAAQNELALPGEVLEGARCTFYSHVQGDALHDALISSLDGANLQPVVDAVKGKANESLVHQLSVLKHQMAHLYLPIDINLQTAEEYRAQRPEEAAEIASRLNEAIKAKQQERMELLDKIRNIVPSDKKQMAEIFLQRAAEEPPALRAGDFHLWLGRIDLALDELRERLR